MLISTLCADQVQVSSISQSGFLFDFLGPERVIACDYISLTPGKFGYQRFVKLDRFKHPKSAARKFNTTVAGV
jgi:hypothetical protein